MLTGEPAYRAVMAAANREQDQDVADEAREAFEGEGLTVHEPDEMCCTVGWWHPGLCPDVQPAPCPNDEHRWRSVGNVYGDVECGVCGVEDNLTPEAANY